MNTIYDISFVHLGITIEKLKNSIDVFGFRIAYYGIIIAFGMLLGMWVASNDAKRRGQNPDLYMDFAMYAIIFSILGARIYYVMFSWDLYKNDIWQIFNIRGGGLAIYGAVIGAALTLLVYTKVKKESFLSMADTGVLGLITGQIIGRFGNFFNAEAFGSYTDNLFAMQIRKDIVSANMLGGDVLSHLVQVQGVDYIQVHPTFLYESMWNLMVLIFMLFYRKNKRFDGEIFFIYLLGYGLGRVWIEGLRTDSLMFFGTGIAVSQALALLCIILALIGIYRGRKRVGTSAIKESV